jgi:SAM-dependent methyltransferase
MDVEAAMGPRLMFILIAGCGTATPADDGEIRALLNPDRALDAGVLAQKVARPGEIVADIGAGPGWLTAPLAGIAKHVIATDIRPEMLAALAKRTHAANIETRLTPADSPGLRPHEVDVAVLVQVDHLLPDRRRWLAALLPSLRTHGRIVVVNVERYRDSFTADATAAGLYKVDEWLPAPGYFADVYQSR